MTTEMAKYVTTGKTSKLVKANTNHARQHLDAVDRARMIYLNQIKRAEADYFERIRLATDIFTNGKEKTAEAPQSTETSLFGS